MDNLLQIITAATALAAVVIGPFVSISVARREIRASVVSANRQSWINDLRDTLADFLAKHARESHFNHLDDAAGGIIPRLEELIRLSTKVAMMTNPKEANHVELVGLLNEMTATITRASDDAKGIDVDKQRAAVVSLTQTILKAEWERVKRGD